MARPLEKGFPAHDTSCSGWCARLGRKRDGHILPGSWPRRVLWGLVDLLAAPVIGRRLDAPNIARLIQRQS